MLLFTPARSAATRRRVPGWPWPHPWGRLTTPGRTASVTSTGASTDPTLLLTVATPPSARPRRAASCGCTCRVQRGLPFTSTSTLCIHELLLRRWRRPTSSNSPASAWRAHSVCRSARRARSAISTGWFNSTMPDGVRSASGRRGWSGPKSTPCGLARSRARLAPCGLAPNAAPNGPVCSMKSSIRGGPGSSPSAARICSGSRPWMGELGSFTPPRTNASMPIASATAGSASGPMPAAIRPSLARISHSSGWPSAGANGASL